MQDNNWELLPKTKNMIVKGAASRMEDFPYS